MKHAFIAAMTALSLCVSASAMAKDLNPVDIFTVEFLLIKTKEISSFPSLLCCDNLCTKGN